MFAPLDSSDNCTTNEAKVSVNDCDEEKQQSKKTSDEEKPIKKARKVRCLRYVKTSYTYTFVSLCSQHVLDTCRRTPNVAIALYGELRNV